MMKNWWNFGFQSFSERKEFAQIWKILPFVILQNDFFSCIEMFSVFFLWSKLTESLKNFPQNLRILRKFYRNPFWSLIYQIYGIFRKGSHSIEFSQNKKRNFGFDFYFVFPLKKPKRFSIRPKKTWKILY